MALEIQIDGAATLHRVAAQIYGKGKDDLSRKMGTALSKAADPLKVSIRSEAEKAMPKSGGYAGLFTKSLKFRLERRNGQQQARVNLITYASGKGERRDIRSLEAGKLRHPVYGRGRRIKLGPTAGTHKANPWAVTSIRAGFHRRGTDHAMEQAQKQLVTVVEGFARDLIK